MLTVPRRISHSYIELRISTAIVNLRTDKRLRKLLLANYKLELLNEGFDKPLGWVTDRIEILKNNIASLERQMTEYGTVVFLKYPDGADVEDTRVQIDAINQAARIIRNREKSTTLKRWRESVQAKQRSQKLIMCLEAFYQEHLEDSVPSASATTKHILKASAELTEHLRESFKRDPGKTRIAIKQFSENLQ